MGARAVKATKEFYYYNGKEIAEKQLNSYRKLSLTERTEEIDSLLSLAGKFPSYYAALVAIANYHAENDDTDKEIPPKLGVRTLYMLTGWKDKPERDPEYMRLLSRRDMAIIHSMIILVEFEGKDWSIRKAADLISETFGKIPESPDMTSETIDPSPKRIDQIWRKAKNNRNNPDMPEYVGFFIHHAGDGAKEIYQSWKEKGFPVVVLSA